MRDRGRLVHISDPDVGLSGGELLILILIWVAVIALVTFVVVMLCRTSGQRRGHDRSILPRPPSTRPAGAGLPGGSFVLPSLRKQA